MLFSIVYVKQTLVNQIDIKIKTEFILKQKIIKRQKTHIHSMLSKSFHGLIFFGGFLISKVERSTDLIQF